MKTDVADWDRGSLPSPVHKLSAADLAKAAMSVGLE